MDVFRLRDSVIGDYSSYSTSFIQIRDPRIKGLVDEEIKQGLLWPEPLIQLNPSFESGQWVDGLVDEGALHEECRSIFRIKKTTSDGSLQQKPLRLHKHQEEAIRAARTGADYVLTTGTGSGKSLAYIVPIVDHVLRNGSGKGVQAIIVYPMNALANSQLGELEKFLGLGYSGKKGPVTFARYTGQENDEERNAIIADPPDIILTNYVMLELILTRPFEKKLVDHAKGLSFLVLDELHTYRGRQGADVAFLVRRTRDFMEASSLQCVGTSATLAGPGSYEQQQAEVARVASLLFGSEVLPTNVIGETLQRATPERDLGDPSFREDLAARIAETGKLPPTDYEAFTNDPLSAWIESTFGVRKDPASGRLLRAVPQTLRGDGGAAQELATLTQVAEDRCADAIQEGLLAGYEALHPETEFPAFAFRLHQFISRGETAYASLEPEEERHLTVYGQQFVPGDRKRILLPMVFCRECGQEYYCVRKTSGPDGIHFTPRELSDRLKDDESEPGYFHVSATNPWPTDTGEVLQRVPEDWLELHKSQFRIAKKRLHWLPEPMAFDSGGKQAEQGLEGHYIGVPFRLCLNCGVSYGARLRSDFAKLTTLGSEGRSTATTILSLSTIRNLRSEQKLKDEARKLLSFTDNRQDASLQAGHFNDFIEVGLLRAGIYRAAFGAREEGLRHHDLTQRVFDALDLPLPAYATDPEVKYQALAETQQAFRDVLGYRIYRDLERGWRVTSPNLEQCGLLDIGYLSLDDATRDEELWEKSHEALVSATSETRSRLAKTLLDFLRRELAIKVNYLDQTYQEQIEQKSRQRLKEPWALDEAESLQYGPVVLPRSREKGDYGGYLYLSPRGGFAQFLRRQTTLPEYEHPLSVAESHEVILQLLDALRKAGIVEKVQDPASKEDVPAYQLNAAALIWKAGTGEHGFHDPIRIPNQPTDGLRANPFFVRFYKEIALGLHGLEAREHTAQVDANLREERETRFRKAELPILFCSPTMELGVDIAELNAVNLRNIPPTPANYAQRSGRAGRSGQPAFVFSYCATGSPHDQYFFKRPELMVSGAVTPPRLDLANEDLVQAHVQATWLKETGFSLGTTLVEILDVSGEEPSLGLLPSAEDAIEDAGARSRAKKRAQRVLSSLEPDLAESDWYSAGWLDDVLRAIPLSFENACNRWRALYKAARNQAKEQTKIVHDASRPQRDKDRAKMLRREAEAQMDLLTKAENVVQSDFYSHRYFAGEGFLPGYNFPRLPLSAFIPGRKKKKGRDEFLSRPRFLAISEFGPRAIVYHEGSRYQINKVILPVEDEEYLTTTAKICTDCGYLHRVVTNPGPDLCENCGTQLAPIFRNLFRLRNVAARRRDRISCDEEERLRLGYELKTGFRFALRKDGPSYRKGVAKGVDEVVARLTYGHAATLWRINMGWSRRTQEEQVGFVLDIERGFWGNNKQLAEEDPEDPMSARVQRVIPFVEDRKNCLILQFDEKLDAPHFASLEAALKNGIQTHYQLEDSEIAGELLPDAEDPRFILFYEAAEGGAGVLRRLLDNPGAFASVAREALNLCHFDPDSGKDLRRPPRATEDCEAACYNCLMSYRNQRVHLMLDRHLVREKLLSLSKGIVEASPVSETREEHLARLHNLCDSGLEHKWIDLLQENRLHLPEAAQLFVEQCTTRPDFLYTEHSAAIYVDGPHHEFPERAQRDRDQTACMENLGFTVIRFGNKEDWEAKIAEYPSVFGKPS